MNSILSFLKSEETDAHPDTRDTRGIYNIKQGRPENNKKPKQTKTNKPTNSLCNIVKLYRTKNAYREL